jgi:hypothetical protein
MIRKIARHLHTMLVNPPPGIRACLLEAAPRARAKDRRTFSTVAEFLSD